MNLPLAITFEQDLGATDMQIYVRAGHIRCELYVPDVRKPVPLAEGDRILMGMIRGALVSHGAPRGMLATQPGAYFLWCLAQHVRATMDSEGPTVALAGLTLSRTLTPENPGLPRLTALVVEPSP